MKTHPGAGVQLDRVTLQNGETTPVGTVNRPGKQEVEERVPQNIMFDRRVCRGSNYLHRSAIPDQQPTKPTPRRRGQRHGSLTSRPEGERQGTDATKTPEPVQGRQHADIQTMNYLEVLEARYEEKDQGMQTDPFLDRPDSPRFVPKKLGDHKQTQVEPGDLFDFDIEVEPILEVLVGKILDQSVMEVIEETELTAIRYKQDQFEQMRNVELAEAQRIEARETRLFEEKQRRKLQEKERLRVEAVTAKKLAARTAAKACLEDLQNKVITTLQASKHFTDPVVTEVESQFMPWIIQTSKQKYSDASVAAAVVNDAVNDALARGVAQNEETAQQRREYLAELAKIRKAKEAEEAAAAAATAAAAAVAAAAEQKPDEE